MPPSTTPTPPATTPAVAAAVFTGPGEPLTIRSVVSREPAVGEVRVRVRCCTICGSDLHTYQGHRTTPTPTVLGHEILGVIESIGPGGATDFAGDPVKLGDRITWSIAASCGRCFYCTRDLPQKCERLFKYGHERIDSANPLSGGLAEHCLLAPGTTIVKIPDELPDEAACPANCATATVAAALRIGGLNRGDSVLILGAGALGLTAAAMAHAAGAARVIGSDVQPARLALLGRFGATDTASPDALADTVTAATGGRGVDLAIDVSGALPAMAAAIPLLRIGGRLVLVGATFTMPDLPVNPERIVRRMLTITGLHNYTPRDLDAAVRFLAAHHRDYPFAELIDGRWPLDQTAAAFEHAITHRSLRVAVCPSERGRG